MHASALTINVRRLAILASLAAALPAVADVATIPVGAISLTAPGPATEGGNPVLTLLALPLEAAPAWRSISTAIAGSALSDSAANWAADIFTTPASPHFLEILSGPAAGRSFLITSHTSNSVTVSHRIAGETLESAAGTGPVEFQIVPGHTLATVFGTAGEGLRKSGSPNSADNVLLWDGTGWEIYFHSGTRWQRAGASPFTSFADTIIHPDEALFLYRREPSPYSMIVTGFAPAYAKAVELPSTSMTLVANRLPTNTTLGELSMQTRLASWKSNASPNAADNLLLWDSGSWQIYYHDGVAWRRSGSSPFTSFNGATISAGTGFLVLRRGESSGVDEIFTQPLNYTLSL